jgi:polyhydroxyalkanoate synthesis repressor PhaR
VADQEQSGEAPPSGGRGKKAAGDKIVIKKYANRRLYNTGSSSYVTLEHLREMVQQNVDFVVYDAKTNDDITRSVLAQIIFDEESKGENLLPIQFLRQLIGFYGDQMQSFVPTYLEMSLNSFTQQQEKMREQFGKFGAGAPGIGAFQDQMRQNMQMFEQAAKMFTPFGFPGAPVAPASATAPETTPPAAPAEDSSLSDLQARMEAMQQEIAKLAKKDK